MVHAIHIQSNNKITCTAVCKVMRTVVWEKFAVGNIHEKKICGKKFSS